MKFKTYQYSKHWTSTTAQDGGQEEMDAASAARAKLDGILSSLLLSENLLVLTGLGTSLCLKDASGQNAIAPTMGDLWQRISQTRPDFQSVLERVQQPKLPNGLWLLDIEELLSRCQMVVEVSNDPVVDSFLKQAESIIRQSCDFLHLLPPGAGLPVHEAFLRKIAKRSTRLPRTKLFTTNYDLCFEAAASRVSFTLIDGFSHTTPQRFDGTAFSYDLVRREGDNDVPTYAPNVLQLHKLHGSVDWARDSQGAVFRSSNPASPVLIYPKNGKFKSAFEQPYFEMMARFQTALRQPNTGLLLVGFGFGDSHLVSPIESAIRANGSLRVVAVGPQYETYRPAAVLAMEKLIDAGDRRISLLASDFESLVASMPDLSSTSEEELHQLRTRNLGARG